MLNAFLPPVFPTLIIHIHMHTHNNIHEHNKKLSKKVCRKYFHLIFCTIFLGHWTVRGYSTIGQVASLCHYRRGYRFCCVWKVISFLEQLNQKKSKHWFPKWRHECDDIDMNRVATSIYIYNSNWLWKINDIFFHTSPVIKSIQKSVVRHSVSCIHIV